MGIVEIIANIIKILRNENIVDQFNFDKIMLCNK